MFISLEQISKLMEKYGVFGTLIIVIIILSLYSFKPKSIINFIIKTVSKLIKKFTKRGRENKSNTNIIEISESDLINHEIFTHIDFWLYSEIPTIEFSSKYRNVVFRKYLHIYFKAYKDNLYVLVNSENYKKMNNSELRQSFMKLITDTVFKYESDMSMSGIPEIIIQKMKTKNNEVLSLTIDLINSICESGFYNSENNLLKVYSLLNIILSILENTVGNNKEVCNSLNGDLKGLTMDGFTEGDD